MNAATAVIAVVIGVMLIKLIPRSPWAFKFALLALMLAAVNITSGWLGRTISGVATFGTGTTSTVTQGAVGAAVPAVLGIGAAIIVGIALWPKHHVLAAQKGLAGGTVAMFAALMLPFWSTSISGPAGGLVRCGVTQAQNVTGGVIGASFGTATLTGIGTPCVSTPGQLIPPATRPSTPAAEGDGGP
jgi:hypothetical protein